MHLVYCNEAPSTQETDSVNNDYTARLADTVLGLAFKAATTYMHISMEAYINNIFVVHSFLKYILLLSRMNLLTDV